MNSVDHIANIELLVGAALHRSDKEAVFRSLGIFSDGDFDSSAVAAAAIESSYHYRCLRCGLVVTYANPGIYSCPSDGSSLIRQWP